MFTIEQINKAGEKIQSGADFPQFARDLKELGVQRSDTYVMNGMAVYFGAGDHTVESGPVYENLLIEEESNVAELKAALKAHQQGETDYQTFCRQAAGAGVEKWIIDFKEMTVSYLDIAGTEMLIEHIPG